MNNEDIRSLITEFIELMEKGRETPLEQERELIRLLDALAYAIHFVHYTEQQDEEFKYPEKKQYESDREVVEQRFPDYGYYNIPTDMLTNLGSSGTIVGDAVDALADIFGELKEVLWRWDVNGEDDALGYFSDFYYFHWQNHLRGLQSYLMARMKAQ